MLKYCARCRRNIPAGAYARHHAVHRRVESPTGTWNPSRDLGKHKRWARAVKKRDGGRCCFVYPETGLRCPAMSNLVAHHLVAGSYEPCDGVTLCELHHRAVDAHAR